MTTIENSGNSKPKGPNFLLICVLASVVLILILIASYFTVGHDGGRLIPKAFDSHEHKTSRLIISDSDRIVVNV